jgi:anti-sigma regulatory factor (Ser/Thr protein kinase)
MESSAIGDARRRVVEQVTRWGCGDLDAIALVCSELITNAVVHAGGAVRVGVTDLGQRIRLEVDDGGRGQPSLRTHEAGPGGLGLRIVAELSEQWGSEPTAGGKRVWAVMAAHRGNEAALSSTATPAR